MSSSVNITALGGAAPDESSSSDMLVYQATQAVATGALGPFTAGMLTQIYTAGFALHFGLRYFRSSAFRADPLRLKLLLVSVQALSLLDTVCNYWSNYHYMTSQQRNTNTLFSQTVVDAFCLVPVGVLGSTVQLYLAFRASKLFASRLSKFTYLGLVALGVASAATGALLYTVLSVLSRDHGTQSIGIFDFNKSMGMYLGSSAAVDVMITIGLCFQYHIRMVGDRRSRTDTVMRRLTRLAIESASYTTAFALIGAVLDFSFSSGDVRRNSTLAFQGPLSSLYYISLLVNLSSRAKIRDLFAATPTLSLPTQQVCYAPGAEVPSFVVGSPAHNGLSRSSFRPSPTFRDNSYELEKSSQDDGQVNGLRSGDAGLVVEVRSATASSDSSIPPHQLV